MLQFEEFKQKTKALDPSLTDLGQALGLDDAREQIQRLEADTAQDGFWDDLQNSQSVLQQIKRLKQNCEVYDRLHTRWADLLTLCEMALEESDESLLPEVMSEYAAVENELESLRLSTLLSGEYDSQSAILSFHAGAGGTEAQDWAQMLYRMYNRWAGTTRLFRLSAGLSRRRGSGTQKRHHLHCGRKCLWLSQKRKRHSPPCAHQPL